MTGSYKDKIAYFLVMALYGTTGIIKRFVPASSGFVALARSAIAMVFIYLFIVVSGRKIDFAAIRKNLKWLLIVGTLLGFNWVCYFEACTNTTVAKATLIYYMAPVIVIILSPFLFREKLTLKKTICVAVAIIGMVLVSGVLSESGIGSVYGIVIAMLSAMLYAAIIICSRQVKDISSYDKTLVQLIIAFICMLVYELLTEDFGAINLTPVQWMLVGVIGILNTGIAYLVYFGSITKLSAQSAAILAYADPTVSVLGSALILGETLGANGIIGAVLMIGAMIVSET